MARWTRKKGDFLVKRSKMTDGEMLHLLVGVLPNSDSDLDDRVYASLQSVQASTGRSALWLFGAGAFGTLSHFGVLKSASASGLEIAPAVFSHVALLWLSFAAMIFCFSYCKQSYLSSWFSYKIKNQPSAIRARTLLLYPDAYWHFIFMPANIGYPPHVHGRRKGYGQLAYVILILVGLLLASIGSIVLWFNIATDVWNSASVSPSTRWLTLSISIIAGLLGWTSPFYYDWSRTYGHYGLVNTLAKLDQEKAMGIHRKMVPIAQRMGLIDPP